ncbi:MAG: hypothetical protein IJT84_05195 [Clostridia bacterium]|nr:hypothetical protein [Clostridia bacterium]
MKIKKMIAICKQNKCIRLFNSKDGQWLSDGYAIFPMYDLPFFDGDSICRTYDITEKQQSKIVFNFEAALPTALNFEDTVDNEQLLTNGDLILLDGGRKLIPYITESGIAFLDGKYLDVVSDYEEGGIDVYARRDTDGDLYFAVKSGFILIGIIAPVRVINSDFVKRIKNLSQMCEVALFNDSTVENNQQNMFEKEP